MNHELFTILLSMSPVSEANASIPVAVLGFHFSIIKAYLLSILGGVILVIPLSLSLRYFTSFVRKHSKIADRFLGWLFAWTRAKHSADFSAKQLVGDDVKRSFFKGPNFYKALALFGFVALPGPFSGIWSASLAGYLFGIPFWESIIAIILGNVVSSIFPALIMAGVIKFL